eukprot:scaffold217815_cov17-Prasinocladus_malaysianus.AAC.1
MIALIADAFQMIEYEYRTVPFAIPYRTVDDRVRVKGPYRTECGVPKRRRYRCERDRHDVR